MLLPELITGVADAPEPGAAAAIITAFATLAGTLLTGFAALKWRQRERQDPEPAGPAGMVSPFEIAREQVTFLRESVSELERNLVSCRDRGRELDAQLADAHRNRERDQRLIEDLRLEKRLVEQDAAEFRGRWSEAKRQLEELDAG